MRLEDLALRLQAVEAKLATLTGTTIDTDAPATIEELDQRLSAVEAQVDQMIAEKTQSHIDAIVAAPAEDAPVSVEDVVALSASADHEQAAAVVAAVVQAQVDAEPVEHEEVADIVAAAVNAVVTADPEVVVDADAITQVIVNAVGEMPAPTPEVEDDAAAAVADVIAAATGVEEIDPEVHDDIMAAVTAPANPELDAIQARLEVVESKVDSLLGK